MRIQLTVAVCLMALPLTGLTDDAQQRYKLLVDEVLEVTGALAIGEQMSNAVVSQMIQAIKSSRTDLPNRAYQLIESEVQNAIKEEVESGSFQELMYPIYAKHLSEDELKALLRFYSTKEGKRVAQTMPLMAAEGMAAGQQWGAALGPKIAQRVQQRLADEGIDVQ